MKLIKDSIECVSMRHIQNPKIPSGVTSFIIVYANRSLQPLSQSENGQYECVRNIQETFLDIWYMKRIKNQI